MPALRIAELPGRAHVSFFAQRKSERGVADGAAHEHAVAHLGAGAAHHGAFRYAAEHGDGDRDRPRRAVGVAAEQRAAEQDGVAAQPFRKSGEPVVADLLRQRQRQQEAERLCALGRQVGQVHSQRLARHALRGILGKEMHAADNRIGLEHQVAARRRLDEGGIVGQAQRARMGRDRLEEARDQTVFTGNIVMRGHNITQRIRPRASCAPADRARH